MYVDGTLHDISGCGTKTTDSNGKVTFTASDLENVTKGMKLVAEVTGDYEWNLPNHPVRVGTAGTGMSLTHDSDGNAYLTMTVENGASIGGSFTLTIRAK